jgi:hypothetical protein
MAMGQGFCADACSLARARRRYVNHQRSAAATHYTQETLDRYLRAEYQAEPSAAQPVVGG